MSDTKTCFACAKPLKGRSDKKFCDDYCRNNYNNQLKAPQTSTERNIINALKKNRNILKSFLPMGEEMTKTTKERLLMKGFLFKYSTHTYENKKGGVYVFCFEYGYLALENDWYLVVKREEKI